MCDRSGMCLRSPLNTEELLPLEIWEEVLKNLKAADLLRASSVCRQWRHLVRRICRERCQRLPPRLLAELTHEYFIKHIPSGARPSVPPSDTSNEMVTDDEVMPLQTESQDTIEEPDWLDINRMLMQTKVTASAGDCIVMRQLEQVTHLATAGDFVVVVSHDDKKLCTIRLIGEAGKECCMLHIKERVLKACVMEIAESPPILAVCMKRTLRCYLVGPQLTSLTPLTVNPELSVDSRLSCDGYTIIVSQMVDEHHLSIYRATLLIEQGHVEFVHEGRIKTSSPPVYWDLWNGFVTTVVSTGHVVSYTLSGNLIAESPLYKDLRYPNPTLLSCGLVFASTVTSRTLLSYWHMDRERDYWLVGESILTSWVQRGPQAVGNTSWIKRSQAEAANNAVASDEGGASDGTGSSPVAYSEPASSCIVTLAKVRVGAAVLLEVTVIYYKRGLVFCGTTQGHMLVYKILSEDKPSHLKINWAVMESYIPSLSLSVTSRPISRLAAYFRNRDIVVVVSDRAGKCSVISLLNTNFISEE